MACTPYQFAQAGMVGTDQAVTGSSEADRNKLLDFVGRSDVASQLQSFGLDAAAATDRVAAMTEEEARYLAGRIDSAPAGANAQGWFILIVVLAYLWWVAIRPAM
jgi:hypothetical protein